MNRLEKIEKRFKRASEVFDLSGAVADDIACLLELVKKYESMLIEVNRLLEGLSSGREIGTDCLTAGENAKRYSHQIQVEIREALTQGRKIKGEE